MIAHERLKTPPTQFGLLIEPQVDALVRAAQADHITPLRDVYLAGQSAADVRTELRQQLGFSGPVVLTGHQVELFHPGVLAKSIAVDALTRRLGGSGVFMATEADLPKQTALTIPRSRRNQIELEKLPLPDIAPHLPVESQPTSHRRDWLQLFTRVGNMLGQYEARLMPIFASAWIFGCTDRVQFAKAMQAARVACEKALGLAALQQTSLAELCQTNAYRRFVAHLIENAERFAATHNQALRTYQQQHGVRNPQRPVAPLIVQGDYVELPFWIYRDQGPRQRLGILRKPEACTLVAGQEEISQLNCGELLSGLADLSPWQIRPRALTLTMFTRLLISDLFIHGIGGAKYDGVTDACAREFYGVELPPIACVSATVRLDLPRNDVSRDNVRAAERAVRDVHFNPQRYYDDFPQELLISRAELIERSKMLRENQPKDHAARRAVFEQIHAVNAELNAWRPGTAEELQQRASELREQLANNKWADHREYFYGLFLKSDLERLCTELRTALGIT